MKRSRRDGNNTWMLKILHARLQPYMNQELPDVQAGFTSLVRFIARYFIILMQLLLEPFS